jgi:hypothetical protein
MYKIMLGQSVMSTCNLHPTFRRLRSSPPPGYDTMIVVVSHPDGCCSALGLHSGYVWIESQRSHQLYWLRFFVVLLSSSCKF